jgi:hypothetical protein
VAEARSHQVTDGWIRLWQGAGREGYPGHTFSPGDADLPNDWPYTNDPDDLMRWAIARFSRLGTEQARSEDAGE